LKEIRFLWPSAFGLQPSAFAKRKSDGLNPKRTDISGRISLPVTSPPFAKFEGEDVVPLASMAPYLERSEILALSEVTSWLRAVGEEADMAAAISQVRKMGGGVALVNQRKVDAQVPLPSGGLISVLPLPVLADEMRRLQNRLAAMGCRLEDPVFTIGFLALSALPWIRLTPGGLLDVKRQEIVYS